MEHENNDILFHIKLEGIKLSNEVKAKIQAGIQNVVLNGLTAGYDEGGDICPPFIVFHWPPKKNFVNNQEWLVIKQINLKLDGAENVAINTTVNLKHFSPNEI